MSVKPGITPTIDRSRIVAPATPANFLARKHLFNLFETSLPGVTVVAAPAGFGKTALVAQWALNVKRPTIWLTINPKDSSQSFFAHILEAIRVQFPAFASDFENEPSANPIANVKRLTTAAGELSADFNFVIDNGSTDNPEVAGFAQLIIDNLPNNVHLVIVRRVTPATSLSRYASLGNLTLITSQDLKFSQEEIDSIAKLNGADILKGKSKSLVQRCEGWPAAIQMMTRSIARGNLDSQFEINSSLNPLAILAAETFNTMNSENRSKISRLLLDSEFDLEAASIMLGDDYSESFINKLVTDGMFVSVSSGSNRIFKFNEIVFEVLSAMNDFDEGHSRLVHEELAGHYLKKGNSSKALEHIYKSGNITQFENTLKTSIREMAAIGRGDQLIKWSEFIADASPHSEMMKKTIKVVGHLVNLDFENAEAMSSELEYISAQKTELGFLTQLTSMVFAHIYFARGEFTRSLEMIERALTPESSYDFIENTDRIGLLRIKASIDFLYDEPDEITKTLQKAKSLLNQGNLTTNAYHLSCITSLALWCEGRFFEAAEQAAIAINQANLIGYSSISAPLDAYMVLARCQLELSQIDKAVQTLTTLVEKSSSSQIWPWFFMAEGTRARIGITKGQAPHTIKVIKEQRAMLAGLKTPNELSWLIDMTELFLRYSLQDWERAEELLRRMPKTEIARQIDLNVRFQAEPKKMPAIVDAFPENTPREKVNKFLYQATINITHENVALGYLNKALEIGAEVGFHEYFVRQHRLYPIMVKAAVAQPTVFRESVVSEMTKRIQGMNANNGSVEERLTSRELEILKHLPTGIPISAIAKQLHISQNTMKTHLRNVYRKLEVDGRHSAVEKGRELLIL